MYNAGFILVHFSEKCFPAAWVESSVEVVFDFQGTPMTDPQDAMRDALWCLLPGRAGGCAVLIAISRQTLIPTLLKRPRLFPSSAHEYVNAIDKLLTQQKEMSKQHLQRLKLKPYKRSWRL